MAGSGNIAVHVEFLARSLMQKGAAPEDEQRATASIHRVSRVPVHLRDSNSKDHYTPGFVAIGPLHDRDRRLAPAERLKVVYLNRLISRDHPDPANQLAVIQDYVRVVAGREQEARALYVSEDVAGIGADDFIQMMVLDGCFIIEHLVNVATGCDEPSLHGTPGPRQLSVDLILAENQIPFFVLVDLIAASRLPEFERTGFPPPVLLVKLVLFYLAGEKGRDMSDADALALPAADGVSHILHLFHEMIFAARTLWAPRPSLSQYGSRARAAMRPLRRLPSLLAVPLLRGLVPNGEGVRRRVRSDYVPSASDMRRMQVKFKKAHGGPGSKPVVGIASVMGPVPLAVTLHEEDQLHLPQLRLESRTAPLLLNLMAFEQSSQVPQDVSSYVAFMAKLVQSAEDAGLLIAAEVLQVQQQQGGAGLEEVARFFQMVGVTSKAASTLQTSYLGVTLEPLRKRSQSWASMDHNYFTLLAELVALVTFVSSFATIIQTFAAFKYH